MPRNAVQPPASMFDRLSALVRLHRSALAVVAAFVGIVVGSLAVLFNLMIEGWMHLTTGVDDYAATPGTIHGIGGWIAALLLILVPVLSGLIYGPLVQRWAPTARGHGIPEVMLAVRRKGGVIPGRVAVVKLVASALTIGGGGSAGREGPIVQIGASVGSSVAVRMRLPRHQVVLLASCGAAGGIAATFHAPLAGAIFALEVILVNFTAETFGFVVVSAVMAAIVSRIFQGDSVLVNIGTNLDLMSMADMGWVAVIGLLAGLTGLGFSKLLYKVEDAIDAVWSKLRAPEWARPGLLAILLGCGLVVFPQMYGSGYPIQLDALSGTYPIGFLLLLLAGRALYTSFTIGMGGSGGVFAPTLFIGAMTGCSFGQLIDPLTATSPAVFGVIAMGAAFAGAARAPMTAVLIIVEMTGQYSLILPMMLAVVMATGTSRFLTRSTIYTEKLRRRGDVLDDPVEGTLLGTKPARELMSPLPAQLSPPSTTSEAVALMRETGAGALPVIDEGGVPRGIVTALDLVAWHDGNVSPDTALADVDLRQVAVRGDDLPSSVLRLLTGTGCEGVPVIDATATGKDQVIGWISQRDLVERMYRAQRRALDAREQSSWGSRWQAKHRHPET